MVASMEDKLNSVKFLIEQGAAVDLHYAVMTDEPFFRVVNSVLIVGASRLCNVSGLTPLFMASNCRNVNVVEYLTKQPETTKEQRCDALELLWASVLTGTVGRQDMGSDQGVVKGLEYIRCGIAERLADSSNLFPKRPVMEPVEAYQYRKESQTVEELAQLEGDRNNVLMESLIISQRILGADNVDLALPIAQCVTFPFEHNSFATYLGLYKRAFNIAKSHSNSAIIEVLYAVILWLDELVDYLPEEMIILQLLARIIDDFSSVLHLPVLKLKDRDQNDLYCSLGDLITNVSKVKDSVVYPSQSISEFVNSIHGLNLKHRGFYGYYTTINATNSLLQYYVTPDGRDENFTDEVKFLLDARFDVNTVDRNGNTLLHLAVNFKPRDNDTRRLSDMLQVLLYGGAHHDFCEQRWQNTHGHGSN